MAHAPASERAALLTTPRAALLSGGAPGSALRVAGRQRNPGGSPLRHGLQPYFVLFFFFFGAGTQTVLSDRSVPSKELMQVVQR